MKQTKNQLEEEIYRLMDSFLIETEPPRRMEQLNQDRHLFVEKLLSLFTKRQEEMVGELEGHKFEMDIKEYLPLVKEWKGGYDVPFDDGYKQAIKDAISIIKKI